MLHLREIDINGAWISSHGLSNSSFRMNDSEVLASQAGFLFQNSFNCAQSVFASLAEKSDLEPKLALKIATPFGGGVSHTGNICGAVNGALMGLGAYFGNDIPNRDIKRKNYEIGKQFIDTFNLEFGNIQCSLLLGLDLSKEEDLLIAQEKDIFHTKCMPYVTGATRIACEIMDQTEKSH
jgi:C_GCAxxG_C_C family probable redox protein